MTEKTTETVHDKLARVKEKLDLLQAKRDEMADVIEQRKAFDAQHRAAHAEIAKTKTEIMDEIRDLAQSLSDA